jgi:hypothetical protein
MNRRVFLESFCALAATLAFTSSDLATKAMLFRAAEDMPNTHNMLVYGTKTIYLSHLPMFHGMNAAKTEYVSPHRYQAILEASFMKGTQNLQNVYSNDRRVNAGVRIYTLNPEEFILSRLIAPSPLTGFKADIFRGHLEKGGTVVPGLAGVDVKIKRVIHFRKFNPAAASPAALKYLLFGSAQETFLAHYINKPPDFDQVLAVKIEAGRFTDAELSKGLEITIPGKRNEASERIRETQRTIGLAQKTASQAVKFTIEANQEIYFEQGELLMPPTFADTMLEKAKT